MKLTKQGVRDLDFGWKKKVVPPVAGDADEGVVSDAPATDAAPASAGSSEAPADAPPAHAGA